MDGIGGVISLIIFIAFAVLRSSQKNAKQQQQQQQRPNTNASSGKSTLQSQLNRTMNQINDIKKAALEQTSGTTQQATFSQNANNSTRQNPYRSSLEGYQMEGTKVEGYQMEGAKVEGYQMEGTKVEGLEQKHSTNKFRPGSIAATESSMSSGFAGEGCDDHYDLELNYTGSIRKGRANTRPLYFSDNPLLQGIVMSQVLERPKRR